MGQVKTTKCSFHAAKMKLKKTNQLHHKHDKKERKRNLLGEMALRGHVASTEPFFTITTYTILQ